MYRKQHRNRSANFVSFTLLKCYTCMACFKVSYVQKPKFCEFYRLQKIPKRVSYLIFRFSYHRFNLPQRRLHRVFTVSEMIAVAILPCIQYMTCVGRVAATVEWQQRFAAHVAATVATTVRSLQRVTPCIYPNTRSGIRHVLRFI